MPTYPTDPVLPPPTAAQNSNMYPQPSNGRAGDSSSPTDSEDGAHRSASDLKTEDDDALDEESVYLTSQTLNADGTPKRPMNAFMIFARKRRPQISAEHQSLRTGDISKLLSQEWNTMPGSEKQFYLEKAKLLKDRFNSKYPDYVYRRRPNNSRRRRKDGTIGSRAGDGHEGDDYGADDVNDGSYATDEKPILTGNTARPTVPGATSGYSYPLPSNMTYAHGPASSSDHRFPPANSSIASEPSTATALSAGNGRHGHPHAFYNHTTLTHSPLQPSSYRLDEPADWSHAHETRGTRTASGWYNSHEREGSNYINTSASARSNGDMLSTLSSPFYSTQHPAGEGQGWLPSQYANPTSEASSSPQHGHPDSPIHYTHPMPPLRHASSYEDRDGMRQSSSHSHSGSERDMYPGQEYSNSSSRSTGSVPPFYDTSTSSNDSYRSSHTPYWPRHSDNH